MTIVLFLLKRSLNCKLGPKCNQNVYAAEEVPAAGKKWHKMCFKCGTTVQFQLVKLESRLFFVFLVKGLCKKMLEAMTMAEHEGNIYCKQCYGRKFGFVEI